MTSSKAPEPASAPMLRSQTSNPQEYKPNWKVIVPIVLISAVVLLVFLPVCALLIVNSTGCCLADGTEKIITFWASMVAGFLALFGMLVTGVFVITSLRVEATARVEAQLAARKEMWTYLKQYHEKFYDDLNELKELAQEAEQTIAEAQEMVEARQREASAAIIHAQSETTHAADEAQGVIAGVRDQTTEVARQAQEAIGGALGRTTDAAAEAQRTIGEVREQTIGTANDAQEAIDNAQQEVQAAAQAARDRIDRAGGAPEGEGGSD